MRIDGHTHSFISDGTEAPHLLVTSAYEHGLDALALTDHDTLSGWDEAQQRADELGIVLVRGVEMSASYQGVSVHMLGYLPDPNDANFLDLLQRIRQSRQVRLQKMVDRLGADLPGITWDNLKQVSDDQPATWGRPHLADLLVLQGYAANRDEAFSKYLHPRGPYYEIQWSPDPIDLVGMARDAGAVPVLAHPFSSRRRPMPDEVIKEMARKGLFGIEAHHREHDKAATQHALELASELGLEVTGGSDYHGTGKPNQLGEYLTTAATMRNIAAEGATEVKGL